MGLALVWAAFLLRADKIHLPVAYTISHYKLSFWAAASAQKESL
jgi:hypothetical protein